MSSALVWQCLRTGNAFTRKGLQGETFSSESGNLMNKHSYKFSGACLAPACAVALGLQVAVLCGTDLDVFFPERYDEMGGEEAADQGWQERAYCTIARL